MDYQDFTVDLRSAGEGLLQAQVDPPDLAPVAIPMPFDREALKNLLTTLDLRASPNNRETVKAPDLRSLGQELYRSLFRNGVADLFRTRREALADDERSGLRLRLRFDLRDPEAGYLGALPWELLREEEELLSIDRCTPVVRDVVRSRPRRPLAVEGPLRILIVSAAIPGSEEERVLKLERDAIARALEDRVEAGRVELALLKGISLDNLRHALLDRDEPVHILHFAGHGGFNEDHRNGAVFFIRPDGSKYQVNAETLADHLKSTPGLRLVVLNSCKTARDAGRTAAPFSFGVAAAVLERTRVQAVVAHQFAISFEAAVRFSEVFYRRIGAGDDVDSALAEVRLSLRNEGGEWATPVLFLSSRNGQLFDVEPAKSPPRRPISRPPSEPVRLGIRSIDGWGRDMDERNDLVLDFVNLFEDRYIRKPESWQEEILPRLQRFLLTNVEERQPLVLDFAAHSSIAFAAGWVLEAKSGLDVRVLQRTQTEMVLDWHPKDYEEHPIPEGPLWLDKRDIQISSKGPDIAVALAVSQRKVAKQVKAYVKRKDLPVQRILRATIAPEPDQKSVKGGAHALLLAQALVSRVRERRPHEREGTCHLFCAAPNALVFYLGQLSRSFGRIVLYEYPFGKKDAWGKYRKSIELEAAPDAPPDWDEW